MKSPFNYQVTDYDCVPTTFVNALQYLFNREEIPPIVIQKIMLYSLDIISTYGYHGYGTSDLSAKLIMQWLEEFPDDKFAFKNCKYISGKKVHLKKGSEIIACMNRGGAVLLQVCSEPKNDMFHYMLGLGIDPTDNDWILFFDPFYRVRKYTGEDSKYIELLGGENRQSANLRIKRERLDSYEYKKYSMSAIENRACCLLERK